MGSYKTVFDRNTNTWMVVNSLHGNVHSTWLTEKEARNVAFDLNHWPHIKKVQEIKLPDNVIPFRKVGR